MCLVALAIGCSERFPLVLASNRDEFLDRPSGPLDWWPTTGDEPAILAGQDLLAGGTWLGLSGRGRLALVTNVRGERHSLTGAPSRGVLVPDWLRSDESFEVHWGRVQAAAYNGFNLIAGDVSEDRWHWASGPAGRSQRLSKGIYGLSNATLDTPWPKVEALKRALGMALADTSNVESLAARLFEALINPRRARDTDLPSTGVSLALERELSSAWIRTADGRYGTRCSTLVITERCSDGEPWTWVIERRYEADTIERKTRLVGWPRRSMTVEAIYEHRVED